MTQPPTDDLAPTEGDVVSGIGSGGSTAPIVPAIAVDFATVVPRFESALLRYVGQLIGRGDQDVEDIVQDAFLRLHRQVHQHGDGSVQNVSTWLFRVAHNLTMDTLRKRKVRRQAQRTLAEDAGSSNPSSSSATGSATIGSEGDIAQHPQHSGLRLPRESAPAQQIEDTLGDMERKEACTLAMSELQTLPEPQRQAVMLKMIEGLTIRQIAEVTETSIGNVGYRISQGLAELSRRLKKAGVI